MLNTANVIHMNTTLYNHKIFRHKSDDIHLIQRVKLHANGSEMVHSILQIVRIRCIFDLKNNGWLIFFLLKAGYIFLIIKYTPHPLLAKNFLHQKIDQHPIPCPENGPNFLLASLATVSIHLNVTSDPYHKILSLIFIVNFNKIANGQSQFHCNQINFYILFGNLS